MKVLVVAEGPSEIGTLDALVSSGGKRGARRVKGFIPPLLRKLLAGIPLRIEAQRVTSLGRFDRKPRPPGHGDRAAKALAIAATQDFDMLVFVKDVDKESGSTASTTERRRRLRVMTAEIDSGFAAVSHSAHVRKVKATPCRMIEAWVLGDAEAVHRVRARTVSEPVPQKPEELWGADHEPSSNHPKCVLRRVLGGDVNAATFEAVANEADPRTLRKTCPDSFAPFADALQRVADEIRSAATSSPARARPTRP